MAVIKIEAENFIKEIQRLTRNSDTSYMDAIVYYAETYDIEIETVAELVKKIPVLKSHLLDEAEILNLVEKSAKLPA